MITIISGSDHCGKTSYILNNGNLANKVFWIDFQRSFTLYRSLKDCGLLYAASQQDNLFTYDKYRGVSLTLDKVFIGVNFKDSTVIVEDIEMYWTGALKQSFKTLQDFVNWFIEELKPLSRKGCNLFVSYTDDESLIGAMSVDIIDTKLYLNLEEIK